MHRTRATRPRLDRGFSFVELVIVIGIICVAAAVTALVSPFAKLAAQADSGSAALAAVLQTSREQAISQRRTILVAFDAPNQVVVRRVDVPGPGSTVLNTYSLEPGVTFRLVDGIPDTPDAFGNHTAMTFAGAATTAFTSEGEFVDEDGDPVNGSLFIGRDGEPLSMRAVTIFGPTALIRQWRWNGTQWNE